MINSGEDHGLPGVSVGGKRRAGPPEPPPAVPPRAGLVRTPEGFLVDPATGEVVSEDTIVDDWYHNWPRSKSPEPSPPPWGRPLIGPMGGPRWLVLAGLLKRTVERAPDDLMPRIARAILSRAPPRTILGAVDWARVPLGSLKSAVLGLVEELGVSGLYRAAQLKSFGDLYAVLQMAGYRKKRPFKQHVTDREKRRQICKAIEEGVPSRRIMELYGISEATLSRFRNKYCRNQAI